MNAQILGTWRPMPSSFSNNNEVVVNCEDKNEDEIENEDWMKATFATSHPQ